MSSPTLPPPLSLEALPLTITDDICEYLAADKRHLFAFSLASASCAAISRRQRLRRVRLPVSEELLRDGSCLRRVRELVATGSSAHVRWLRLDQGPEPPPQIHVPGEVEGYPGDLGEETELDHLEPDWGTFDDESGLLWPKFQEFSPTPPEDKARLNRLWEPLADLIGSLTHLTDLIYACRSEVPTHLLDMLHTNRRDVRLHVESLSLRSLYQPMNDASRPIGQDEYMLATSPSLHSAATKWFVFGPDGEMSFVRDAVIQMVSHSAPNLASLTLESRDPGYSAGMRTAFLTPTHMLPVWKGFDGSGRTAHDPARAPKGALARLACNSDDLQALKHVIDFSRLSTLAVKYVDLKAVRLLRQLARDHGFPSLTWLDLSLDIGYLEDAHEMDGEAAALMGSLHPLRTLFLKGLVGDETVQATLDNHGRSLVQFKLLPSSAYGVEAAAVTLTPRHIERLCASCPRLRQFEVRLPRTEGDAVEVSMYRELGRLPRLESLCIRLYCPDQESRPVREGEEFVYVLGQRVPACLLRRGLVNCAVDQRLALSIFQAISDGGPSSVGYLKIQVDNVADFAPWAGEPDIVAVLEWIARNWVCEREWQSRRVSVREVAHDHDSRAQRGVGDLLMTDFKLADLEEGECLRAVWTSLWPGPPGDRRRHWSSMPLARGDLDSIDPESTNLYQGGVQGQ